MTLPFAHQGFIAKPSYQPQTGRSRYHGYVFPLLIAFQDFLGSDCQLLIDSAMLLDVPHVVLWLYHIRHVKEDYVSTPKRTARKWQMGNRRRFDPSRMRDRPRFGSAAD